MSGAADFDIVAGGTAPGSGTKSNPPQRPADFVQSLERGLAVIKAFGPGTAELSLSDVARETGLSRAAARRFLRTLAHLGYVHFDGRLFSLRPRTLELGYAYLSTLSFTDVAAPHMEELVAQVHESSSVSVLDGEDIVYVVRVPTTRIMTVAIAIGTRLPAYATSMGRVLLAALSATELDAYLEQVRLRPFTARTTTDVIALRAALADVGTQGYAVVDQELEDGLRSVAAPLVDPTGQVIAAINVSVHASRVSLDVLRRTHLPMLLATVEAIQRDLTPLRSHRGPSPSAFGGSAAPDQETAPA